MLKQRILTALVLLPVALCGFFLLDGLAFALFIGAVVSLGAWEWAQLAGVAQPWGRVGYGLLVAALCALLYQHPEWAGAVLLAGAVWWCLACVLVLNYPRRGGWLYASRPLGLLLGLLVLLPAWQGLMQLKVWPQGNLLILAVMVLVWGADIGAYFSGRRFGRRKLAPQVSPGKSWEGVYGGLGLCLALMLGVVLWLGWDAHRVSQALLGTVLVVAASIVGDLTESLFKRKSGIKDSSNLLPGHGGVMDRIDSLTAAIPVFVALLWLMGWGV